MYILINLLLILVFLIWYLSKPFYWKKKNVPHLTPLPIFGNCLPIIKYGIRNYFINLSEKFPGHKYFGMHLLNRPALFIKDSEIIQKLLIKDFDYFSSRGAYSNQDRDPAGGNIAIINGQQWKEIKGKLSPYFTPGKVKEMLRYVDSTMPKFTAVLDEFVAQGRPCEISELFQGVSADIIAQAVFGVETDLFTNEHSIFDDVNKKLFTKKFTLNFFISVVSSKLYDLLKLIFLDRALTKLIEDIVVKTINYRRENNIYRQDFLQGMMELLDTKQTNEKKYFPDNTRVPVYNLDTVISQAVLLYIGGVETTAFTMTFFLYEMAVNPEIQTKCRNEVNSVVDNDEPLSVDHLSKLPYLTAAIQETLRIHSPAIFITRECTKEYRLPESDVTIEPGTLIIFSPVGKHLNIDHFPEPKIFRPERFLDEKDNTMISGAYLPFGAGPRSCIGMSLAYGELKLVLGRLLQQYEFHVCSQTLVPVEYSKFQYVTKPVNGMWLTVKSVEVSKTS